VVPVRRVRSKPQERSIALSQPEERPLCHTEKDFRSMEESLAIVEETSTEYVGRWNRLISTTNWEKGRIILEWRRALEEAGAPDSSSSDEAWSRQVGGVSPQHVGRLRRVFERFGEVHTQYAHLYWSHFQAAIDWDDAEMWLEGAVQSGWSVARMCDQRWEALGVPPDQQPPASDFSAADMDEDVVDDPRHAPTISDSVAEVHGDDDSEAFFDANGDAHDHASDAERDDSSSSDAADATPRAAAEPTRPFETLPAMPDDMQEAFERFKLAILNQKVSGWQEIARDDVLTVLDSLRQLALAPAE
jgi:hypothetical protein